MLSFKFLSIIQDIPKLYLLSSINLHTTNICNIKKRKNSPNCGSKSVAVILCGCGALDGTEISEAVSIAIHCSQKGLKPEFYAPEVDICEVADHYTKKVTDENRNALTESARLARSSIQPLCECNSSSAVALIIPGGFGAAKTLGKFTTGAVFTTGTATITVPSGIGLVSIDTGMVPSKSNFASEGSNCTILPDVERIIEDFSCNKKPIGAICIAAALIAKVLKGVKVTLGKPIPEDKWPFGKAIDKVRKMGAKVEKRDVKGVTHCKKYNVFSTPAWMYSPATYNDVHIGIGKMITKMNKQIK